MINVRGSGLQPLGRVLQVDAAADLQSAGKRRQRRAGLGLVVRAEHDHVAAVEMVAPVEFRKVGRAVIGDEIGPRSTLAQRAADDLLHLAFMEVDAGPEHGIKARPG